MTTDATCTVGGVSTANGTNVAGGAGFHIALQSTAGVEKWVLTCIGTDERFDPNTVTLGLTINLVTKTADGTMVTDDGLGAAWVFQSQVNDGEDDNGNPVEEYTRTFAVYMPCANGLRVSALNETFENSAAFGWTKKFNDTVRNALPGLGVAVADTPNTVPLRDAAGGIQTSVEYDVAPIGGGSDDGAALSALLAGSVAGRLLRMKPGTYTFATPCVVPSKTVIEMGPQVVIHSTMANTGVGGFANACFFATKSGAGSTNNLTANAVQGTNQVVVTSAVAVGSVIMIGFTLGGNQEQQATVLASTGSGPYTLTLDEEILYSYWTTANGAYVYVITPPSHITILGNGAKVYGTGDRVCEFAFAREVHVSGIIVDQKLGNGVDGFKNILFSFDIGCRDCSYRECRADGGASYLSGVVALAGFASESNNRCKFEDLLAENLDPSTGQGFGIYDSRNCDFEAIATRNSVTGVYIGSNDSHGADGARGISIRKVATQNCSLTSINFDKTSQGGIVGWLSIGDGSAFEQSGAATFAVSQFYWQAKVAGSWNGFLSIFGEMDLTDGRIDMTSTSGTKAVCDWGSGAAGTLRLANVTTVAGTYGLYLEDGIAQKVHIGRGVDFSSCGTPFRKGSLSVIVALTLAVSGTNLVESLSPSGLTGRSWHDSTEGDTIDWTLASAGASSMSIAAGVTFTFTQATATSDVACKDLTLAPQPPFASATGTHTIPGNLVVSLATPSNSGAVSAAFKVNEGGTTYVSMGHYGPGNAYGSYWAGSTTPSSTNFCFLGDGASFSYLNVQAGGSISLSFGGIGATGLDLTSTTMTLKPATMQWQSSVTSPTITQTVLAGTGATAGKALTVQAQAGQAQTGSATNNNGGTLALKGGVAGTGGSGTAGLQGTVSVTCGTQTIGAFTSLAATDARFLLDTSAAYFVFAANGTSQFVDFQAIGSGGAVYFDTGNLVFRDGSASIVITGVIASAGTTSLTVAATVTAFLLKQADRTTNSGVGASFTLQAQNETGTTSTGGSMTVQSGTGTSADGHLNLFVGNGGNAGIVVTDSSITMSCVGGDTQIAVNSSETISLGATNQLVLTSAGRLTLDNTIIAIGGGVPLVWGSTTLSATTGTTTLSSAQQATPVIVYSASLSGSVVVDFGNIAGSWLIDIRLVTLNAHTVSVKSGTTTVALPTATTTQNLFNIRTDGSNGISIG